MNKKHYIGENAKSFESLGMTDRIDGVLLKVDSATAYMAGDQTGYVLEAECPYGTQAMADGLLAAVQGKDYAGFEASGARLPVGAELGDGVTVKGLYGPLVRRRIRFGAELSADISAPAGGDTDHEFGYTDPVQRKIELAEARSRSYVDRRADEICIGVEALDKDIRAELALKVGVDDNGRVVSMLNAAADQIDIKGDRFVLDSTNFKVAADGTVTAKNANVEGDVKARSFSLNDVGIYTGEEEFTNYDIHPESASKTNLSQFVQSLIIEAAHQIVAKGYLAAKNGSILDLYAEKLLADSITALELLCGPVTTYGPITVNEAPNKKGSAIVTAQTFFGRMGQSLSFSGGASGRYDGSTALSVHLPIVRTGSETITPTAENVPTPQKVELKGFPGTPCIFVSASSTEPGRRVTGVSFSDVSESGFTIWVTRTNTTPTAVHWMAVYE